jgi:hypothetical protein
MSRAFEKAFFLRRLQQLYRMEPVEERLQEAFGDTAFGDEGLKTALCVVTTRLDKQRPYAFLNDPRAPDFANVRGTPLKDVITAGMAMPVYYKPKLLTLDGKSPESFVAGEITIGGDPALYLFLLATGADFSLKWRAGRRRLYLLSLGAGKSPKYQMSGSQNAFSWLANMPSLFMSGAMYQSEMLLKSLAWGSKPSDSGGRGAGATGELMEAEPSLTYRRYDVALDAGSVSSLGFPDFARRLERTGSDDPAALEDFISLGHSAAAGQVSGEHFTGSFDVMKPVGAKEPAGEQKAPAV